MKIELQNPNCKPFKKHFTDAGFDLRSNNDSFDLHYGEIVPIYTGVSVAIPVARFGLVVPRSGLGSQGLAMANTVGIIDSEYRGEIIVKVLNKSERPIRINRYDRIAQLIIVPVVLTDLEIVDELDSTIRGDRGFGASGVA